MANAARPDILRFMATYVTRKAHVALPFFLFSGEPYFLRIDDDHKITRIHMWRKNRFLFAAQQVRRLHSHLSQHLILGVDDPPLARDFAGFGRKCFHWEKEHGNYERPNSMSTHRRADETHKFSGIDEPIAEMLAGQLAFARLILRHVEPENDTNRNYTAAGRRFSGMVSAGHSRGGIGRAVRRAWLHGDSPVGVRNLGKHAASTRCDVSRHR